VVGKIKGDKKIGIYKRTLGYFVKMIPKYSIRETIKKMIEKGYELRIAEDKEAHYATGKKKSGIIEPYKGTLYHGTENIDFFNETHDSTSLGFGSHLKSLNSGDAMSLTNNFEIASEFSSGVMIIEFDVDLSVYYAPEYEDDLDEINVPDEADSVAIPFGKYQEYEIALIRMDNNVTEKAVHLMVNGKWKKYQTRSDIAYYHGAWHAYGEKWANDVFNGDFEKILDSIYDNFSRVDMETIDDIDGFGFRYEEVFINMKEKKIVWLEDDSEYESIKDFESMISNRQRT
jgi:hypothetical protein